MRGRRIGVYGMGEIGRKIAARVAAFETEVGYFSRSQARRALSIFSEPGGAGGMVQRADDRGSRRRARPTTPSTPTSCSKLGEDGYVVNIARGSVIDQKALVAALTDKTIAGAGLDVYAKEPHAPDALTALAERRADPAYRRPYAGIARRDAGLRDRQSRGVFRGQAACRYAVGTSERSLGASPGGIEI